MITVRVVTCCMHFCTCGSFGSCGRFRTAQVCQLGQDEPLRSHGRPPGLPGCTRRIRRRLRQQRRGHLQRRHRPAGRRRGRHRRPRPAGRRCICVMGPTDATWSPCRWSCCPWLAHIGDVCLPRLQFSESSFLLLGGSWRVWFRCPCPAHDDDKRLPRLHENTFLSPESAACIWRLQSKLWFVFILLFYSTAAMEVENRQRQLKQVVRFSIGGCGSIFLNPVKPPSYLRLKNTYPRRHRLIRQSRGAPAGTRNLDASIVATSHGPCGPNGPHAPNGSITYVFRSRSAVTFTWLCYVIWEFFSHVGVLCFNVVY
jgi:hypothetical protein